MVIVDTKRHQGRDKMSLSTGTGTRWHQLSLCEAVVGPATLLELVFEEDIAAWDAQGATTELAAVCKTANFDAKRGVWLDLVAQAAGFERRLVLGAGSRRTMGNEAWVGIGGNLVDAMVALRVTDVRMPVPLIDDEAAQGLMLGALLHSFQLEQYRSLARAGFRPSRLLFNPAQASSARLAERIARSVNRARAWVEQPANLLNPRTFADEARVLEATGVRVEVFESEALQAMGAGALLAVGRGAEHAPRLVVAEWRGDADRPGWDAALVGKGLTFDSGGLNLKARPGIAKMKFDMAGGAAVLAAVELAASRRTRCNVVAVVPIAENAVDALSFRPGDVITSMAGLTIEVADTDAEGRLVLADALTFSQQRYAPRFIVDVATLTGAVTSVFHEEFAACFASNEELATALLVAGAKTGEELWRLPLVDKQDYLVDSEVADVANVGVPGFVGAGAGSPTAGAKFLERFTRKTRWAHLDIAGMAWSSRRTAFRPKGATGFGVRLLDQWLADLAFDG